MMKRFFLDNMFLKAASLVLAVALWFYVTSTGQSEIKMEVPLIIKNIPEKLVVVQKKQTTVSVKLKGHFRILEDIRPSDVVVSADLTDAKEKTNFIKLSAKNIHLPSTVKVTHLFPTTVKLFLEKKSSTTVKVKPSISGSPNENFYIKQISVSPEKVIVEGAHSLIMKLHSLRTRPIDISGATETIIQDVMVDIGDRNIALDNDKVTVRVTIVEKQ